MLTSSGRGAFNVNDASIYAANGSATRLGSSGDSVADFLLGLTYTSTVGTTAGTVYLNYQGQDFFVQDDWKIRSNLTLNLGLRYEVDQPVYSPSNTVSNFLLAQQIFLPAGSGGYKHLYNYDYNNLAPRIGFSLQPGGNDHTVIKGRLWHVL